MKLSVSYLSSNYNKEKTIQMLEKTACDYIHVDLMDGGFVNNKNFTIDEILSLFKNHIKPLDIHLMTFDPIIYIKDLIKLEPEFITFHLESTNDVVKTIELIKNNKCKVGIAVKPNTDILELMPYLSFIDLVLIMSVEPGLGGQAFIEKSVEKLNNLLKIREDNNLSFKISMDGGINDEIIKKVKDLDIVVSGSFICKSDNYEEKISILKEASL